MNSSRFLYRNGNDCVIQRTTLVTTKALAKLATKSTVTTTYRDAMREGIILPDVSLQSGEVVSLDGDELLVQTVTQDKSGLTVFYAAKTNCTVTHKRLVETLDSDFNLVLEWQTIGTYKAFGQLVNAYIRQEDPGLLPTTEETFTLNGSDIQLLDRFVVNGHNLRVDDVDSLFLPGLSRIQCSADSRE